MLLEEAIQTNPFGAVLPAVSMDCTQLLALFHWTPLGPTLHCLETSRRIKDEACEPRHTSFLSMKLTGPSGDQTRDLELVSTTPNMPKTNTGLRPEELQTTRKNVINRAAGKHKK